MIRRHKLEVLCSVNKIETNKSGEDGLLTPLLGQDRSRFVLGVWVVSELRRAGGHRALQDGLLQVVEHRRVLLGQERHGHTTLTSTTSTTDTMDVVFGGRSETWLCLCCF